MKQLFYCPLCGETLSSPPRFYICPLRPARVPSEDGRTAPSRKERNSLSDADFERVRTGDLAGAKLADVAAALDISLSYASLIRRGLRGGAEKAAA